jgi:hypothetical protein
MTLTRALCSYFLPGFSFADSTVNSRIHFARSFFARLFGVSTPRLLTATVAAMSLTAVVLVIGLTAQAASISYGNFNIPAASIMFQGVTESSGTDAVPQYGPPDPFVVGLDFDPTNFVATSAGGGADITDGQLNFTIMGLVSPGGFVGINGINLFEAGDYTLAGVGTPATSVFAGAILRATVTQISGLPVAPIGLIPVNASVGFSLPGMAIAQPWSLGMFMNIGAQLAGLGYGPGDVATKVEIAVNNSLVATSESSSASFIAKKDFRIQLVPEVVGDPFIPEPSTLVLAMVALCGLRTAVGRRRS